MKKRIIYHPDKSISIINSAPHSRKANETEDGWLQRIFDRATPTGAIYEDIDISQDPKTKEYRDGWEGELGKPITVNAAKAEQIKADKETEIRIEALAKLGLTEEDVAKIKALGD